LSLVLGLKDEKKGGGKEGGVRMGKDGVRERREIATNHLDDELCSLGVLLSDLKERSR